MLATSGEGSSVRQARARSVVAASGTSRNTTPCSGDAWTDSGARATPRPAATRASSTAVPGASCSRCGVNPASRQLRNTASFTAEWLSAYITNGSTRRSVIARSGSSTNRWSAGSAATSRSRAMVRVVMPSRPTGGRSTPRSRWPSSRPSSWVGVSRSAWISSATPGSSALISRAMRGSQVFAAVPVNAIRTSPCLPSAMRRTPRALSSTAASTRRASRWRNSPAGVSCTWRVVRVNSETPSSASSWRTDWESAGWARCSRSAARPKCRVSATAAK